MSSQSTEQQITKQPARTRRPVNLRSIGLGLLGVLFICGLTAYNDFVVANTFMVGNFLPIGLLLFFLCVILLINAPLRRFAPRMALSMGELGVALSMTLVACAVPSSGLMRYLPAHMVGPWYQAGVNGDHAKVLESADLPSWLFPDFTREGTQARANDPVVQYFRGRVPLEETGLWARITAVPWHAWITPAISWGIFFSLIVGAMLCLSVVFRRQWVENERLPYPLASVYLSVIEEPEEGKLFNTLFSSRWFWISALAVFAIHGVNAMHEYYPRIWPQIPIGYAFSGIFANPPLIFTDWGFKTASIYFCMVGIVYFLQSNVAFSLWFMFILLQVTKMFYGSRQAELTTGMQQDQNMGAVLVFAAMILFVGRHQLLLVARQMFRKPQPEEAQGRYLPYFAAGWGLVLCTAGLIGFLVLAGASVFAAVVTIGMAGMLYLVLARVVAETGLMFVQLSVPVYRPLNILAQALPESLAAKVSTRSFYLASWINGTYVSDQRESLSGFMPQTLRVADGAAFEREKSWRRVLPFTLCLVGALLVGYLVAGTSMLYCEYNYAAEQDRVGRSPINPYGMDASAQDILNATKDYAEKGGGSENHNRWGNIGVGAVITGALAVLRLRFANWPLHPVGYLLVFSYPMKRIWLSIFVGWLAKVLVVKFGGSSLYRGAKPVFMGLIIGEVGAAAFWLVVSLVLNTMGYDFRAIRLLPT